MSRERAHSPAAADVADAARARLANASTTSTRQLFRDVAALLDNDVPAPQAQAVEMLGDLLDLQATEMSARNVGQFPMHLGRPPEDLNSALFLLPIMLDLSDRHAAKLPAGLRGRLEAAVRRAVVAAERRWDEEVFDPHRDHKAYTNIFLLYVQALLLAGRHADDARLLRMAHGQWQRWFNHVAYFGIDEFVSTTYSNVDDEALVRLHAEAIDEPMRQQVKQVLDHLTTVQHAVTHPLMQVPVCGSSRDYRRMWPGGACEPRCVERGGAAARRYQAPPHVVAGYRERRFPYGVSGRATHVPFCYQSWQLPRAGLGSMTGGNYFWQQIHCMAAVGESAERRELLLLPGAYTVAGGYVAQHEHRALCLFARRPNTFLRTQRHTPDDQLAAAFGDIGLGFTDGWQLETTGGGLSFHAYGHAVHVRPFTLDGETIQPVTLERVRRANLSQGRFHDTPVDMQEAVFPAAGEWVGCTVELLEAGHPAQPSALTCERTDRVLSVGDGRGLTVSLFLQPSGEVTELYDPDWRTQPLLQCPEQTLWPGAWMAGSSPHAPTAGQGSSISAK